MTASATVTASIAPIANAPDALLANIANMGRMDRAAQDGAAVLKSASPPIVLAALAMHDAATAGDITMANLPALMDAYYGNDKPASLTQQQSKFGSFIKSGTVGVPAGQSVCRAIAIVNAKRAAAATLDKDDAKKSLRECDKMQSGMWAKSLKIVSAQMKAGAVALSDDDIMGVLLPDTTSEDPFGDALADMFKRLDAAANLVGGTFHGYADIYNALAVAQNAHEKTLKVVAENNAAVPAAPVAPVPTPVAQAQAVEAAGTELEDLLEAA